MVTRIALMCGLTLIASLNIPTCPAAEPEDRLFADLFARQRQTRPPAPDTNWKLTSADEADWRTEQLISDAEYLAESPADPLTPVEEADSGAVPASYACNDSSCAFMVDCWQILPEGLLFHSYAAGEKEPRFAAQWLWERDRGLIWETALGGRIGIVRNGTVGRIDPQGFQLDLEGAAFPRVDLEEDQDLEAVDFRIGIVGTWRRDRWRYKFGYYHLSSHVGDEFLLRNPGIHRRNYVRDAFLGAVMYDIRPDLQVYLEVSVAFNYNGGAEPAELQYGIQYLPAVPGTWRGAPFAAVNGHWRQEFGAEASINAEAGWMWRGLNGHTYRVGFQHYSGPSLQYSFFDQYESLTGIGMWMDF